jgi:hypothetical protein
MNTPNGTFTKVTCSYYCAAIRSNGSLALWHLADPSVYPPPAIPITIVATELAVGDGGQVCIITYGSAALRCWVSKYGRSGSSAEAVVPDTTNLSSIAIAVEFACALMLNSSVLCWSLPSYSPKALQQWITLDNVIEVTSGQKQVCARFVNRTGYCWSPLEVLDADNQVPIYVAQAPQTFYQNALVLPCLLGTYSDAPGLVVAPLMIHTRLTRHRGVQICHRDV